MDEKNETLLSIGIYINEFCNFEEWNKAKELEKAYDILNKCFDNGLVEKE